MTTGTKFVASVFVQLGFPTRGKLGWQSLQRSATTLGDCRCFEQRLTIAPFSKVHLSRNIQNEFAI
jgi:hypothetical protein